MRCGLLFADVFQLYGAIVLMLNRCGQQGANGEGGLRK
jgi:hypothetical protein